MTGSEGKTGRLPGGIDRIWDIASLKTVQPPKKVSFLRYLNYVTDLKDEKAKIVINNTLQRDAYQLKNKMNVIFETGNSKIIAYYSYYYYYKVLFYVISRIN